MCLVEEKKNHQTKRELDSKDEMIVSAFILSV